MGSNTIDLCKKNMTLYGKSTIDQIRQLMKSLTILGRSQLPYELRQIDDLLCKRTLKGVVGGGDVIVPGTKRPYCIFFNVPLEIASKHTHHLELLL